MSSPRPTEPVPAPRISAIVPAHNAEHDIVACLAPLVEMRERGEITEIVVVDDASLDATPSRANDAGADRVVVCAPQCGAAGARNAGAHAASGDILWFVDSDVVAHDNAALILRETLNDRMPDAVFGAYGDRPAAGNFLSQYKNLIHHDTHSRSPGPAETFWTGCGAVRRPAFEAVGGFDAERFRHVGMEDVDFGYRLRAAGYCIHLEPALQGEHRKRWTLRNLLRVEIFHRALPWSRLMLANRNTAPSLNVDGGERLRALIAGLAVLALILAASPWGGWPLVLAAAIAVVAANRRLLCFFHAKRGPIFAIRAVLFHQLYYLYSGTTFVYAWLEHHGRRATRPGR